MKRILQVSLMLLLLLIGETAVVRANDSSTALESSDEALVIDTIPVSEELENDFELLELETPVEIVQIENEESTVSPEVMTEDTTLLNVTRAFADSSRPLEEALVAKYGTGLDLNDDKIISVQEANAFTGPLTVDWGTIPTAGTLDGIGHFIQITDLVLMNSKLTGSIPREIGNLTNLKTINLNGNQLSGAIPAEIGNLENLTTINLMTNQLSGAVPESIGNLSQLFSLGLSNNRITELPESIGRLVNLEELNIQNAQLTSIPDSVANLTNLYAVLLTLNPLKEVPAALENLTEITYLDLAYTQLTEIPEWFVNLDKLDYVNLGWNQLTDVSDTLFNFMNTRARLGRLTNQKIEQTLSEVATMDIDYSFVAYPAYTQFPNYDVEGPFTYRLKMPDGTDKSITPILSDSTLTVSGADLTQMGNYTLIASVANTGQVFKGTTYTTHFQVMVKQNLDFVSVDVNGDPFKTTTTMLTLALSDEPAYTDLMIYDINLIPKTSDATVHRESLRNLGSGIYELTIKGTWTEGTYVDVILSNELINFNPKLHTVALHALKQYEVSFDSNGGSAVTSQTITHDEFLAIPEIPTKDGYTFKGWYLTPELETIWNFDESRVTADSVLYAKWEANVYDVDFQANGGNAIASQQIAYEHEIVKPEDPLRKGYLFEGWYTTPELETAWNFENDRIVGNTTLYAKWRVDESYIDETTHKIEADDITISVSELVKLNEESFLALAQAVVVKHDITPFALTDTLKVLDHTIEAKPGVYSATIALHENENVKTAIQVAVYDDAVNDIPVIATPIANTKTNAQTSFLGQRNASILPATGVSMDQSSLSFVALGILLIISQRRK